MKKILVNKEIWQTRIAILQEGKLQDVYFASENKKELERCFFKGKVLKVLPGIQTAFVDIGESKSGFLHITEIDRALALEKSLDFFSGDESKFQEDLEKHVKKSIAIEKILSEGENILVQVLKEPVYEKGAKLTTCFTLPGKFVVLMPNIPQIGVSKKIENREERNRLREIIIKNLPQKMGAIIRTTAEGRPAKDIKKDLAILISTWKTIQRRFKKAKPGEKIYEDIPITIRTVREHLDDNVDTVWIDNKKDYDAIYKFVKYFTPEQTRKLQLYKGEENLFERYNVNKQIEEALHKKVSLKSGGSLIIETTEAMTVIDVNTGKYTGKGNLEDTILKTNIEAAEEIVRQLRLRNIGGLIVIDFIDMSSNINKQKLSKFLEKTLKEKDKYQSVILKISEFGLVQMTRKRSGKTLLQQLTSTCSCCKGTGFTKSDATITYEIFRKFKEEYLRHQINKPIALSVSPKIFHYIIYNEYQSILKLEKSLGNKIIVETDQKLGEDQFKINKI